MGKPKKIMEETFYVMQKFACFGKGTKLYCIFYGDYIEFRAPGKDAPTATLQYHHIVEVLSGAQSELIQVDKSYAARYVIGHLLAGATGGMAGALSAKQNEGKKSKQVIVRYLIIGYKGKDGKEKLIILQSKDRNAPKSAEQLIRAKTGMPQRTEL